MIDVRTLSDERLDLAYSVVGQTGNVAREIRRRAEIRINRLFMSADERAAYGIVRDEINLPHDASWYESRQTEAQFLAEMGE